MRGRGAARSVACVFAVAALASAGPARAQQPALPVEIIATEPGSSVLVRGDGRDFPCGERCVLSLPENRYRVLLRDPEGHGSSSVLSLFEPTSVVVSPANSDEKVRGVGLFVGGVVATAVGGALLFLAASNDHQYASTMCAHCSKAPTWQRVAGGASLAIGVALGMTGMFAWRGNARARLQTRPLAVSSLQP